MSRKGIENIPLELPKLPPSEIPKLQDFVTELFRQFVQEEEKKKLCQFCEENTAYENFITCQTCFNMFDQFEYLHLDDENTKN